MSSKTSIGTNLELKFTHEEMAFVNWLGQIYDETSCSKYYLMYSQDVETLTSWVSASFKGEILNYEHIQKMEWSDNIFLNEVGLLYLSIEDLTSFEQAVLVQCNVSKVVAFMWALCNETVDTITFIDKLTAYGIENQVKYKIYQEYFRKFLHKCYIGYFRTGDKKISSKRTK